MASISTSIFEQDDLGKKLQAHRQSLACMYLLASFSTRFCCFLFPQQHSAIQVFISQLSTFCMLFLTLYRPDS